MHRRQQLRLNSVSHLVAVRPPQLSPFDKPTAIDDVDLSSQHPRTSEEEQHRCAPRSTLANTAFEVESPRP